MTMSFYILIKIFNFGNLMICPDTFLELKCYHQRFAPLPSFLINFILGYIDFYKV